MHEAYSVFPVLKHGVQIESIAAYGNNVIIGTRSGQLIMYSVDDDGVVDMSMFNKNFSKKPIVQMEVIVSENMLFTLTDNTINVCDISRSEGNFAFIHCANDSRGCTLFALDVRTPKSTTGELATVIRVCCAIKRKLHFFYWKADALQSPDYNIDLKDVPKAICWFNDFVCVGYRDEYVLYNISSAIPEQHDLIVTSSSNSMDPCICLLRNHILGVSKDDYLVAIDSVKYLKDAKQTTQDTNPPPKPLQWSSPLLGIVWDEPYVIGCLASNVEVRSLSASSSSAYKDSLIQKLPDLSRIKFVTRAESGIVFAGSTNELWCIRAVSPQKQRQQLLQQKKFQLAIELTQISDEPPDVQAETIRQIHKRNARELFDARSFPAAMKEFERAAAYPYDVIRLFPDLLQDSNKRSAVDANEPTVQPVSMADNDLENALTALIDYLVKARYAEMAKIRDDKHSSKALLSIINTTLLKCYLQTNDSLIAPLLRQNHCHLDESEKCLKKYDKIAELIILYQVNGKHKKALELLQSQANAAGSSLFGYERTIRYLQELGSSHLPLIFEFADWVLRKHPEDGLRIFTDDLIEVESLPRASVLDFLLAKHKPLVIPYLEHVVNVWKDTNTLIHNVLIKQYITKVTQLMADAENGTSSDLLLEYRKKLYDMLENSTQYSPYVILQTFPTNILLEERVLLLGRLKQHDEALAIYVLILGDMNKAIAYCEEQYNSDKQIFVSLLKTILLKNVDICQKFDGVPLHPDFAEPNNELVIELLNEYAIKISPDKIVEHLPADIAFDRLHTYLDTVMRTRIAENHQSAITAGLLTAEISRVTKEIQALQSKSFEINESSVCSECRRRFANQKPFVRYPNGKILHLSCHDKIMQRVKENSLEKN